MSPLSHLNNFLVKRISIWLIAFFAFVQLLTAQNLTIRGQVLDAKDGFPLPGVAVTVKGTLTGTATDIDGNYQVEAPSNGVLVFSFIGLRTEEVPVNGRITINLQMQEDVIALSEVVVVGYGIQKKVNLSGAVDQISPQQIEARPIANLSQGLQGLVPNLNVDFASGEPGQGANFNIRGFTSINGGSPLFVVDGVPFDPDQLNFLNPNDIASISILKDASSAAIYGARAAFGVVLITTKTGKDNKITYTNFFAAARPTVLPKPITDPYIFSRLLEISTNNTPWDYTNYSDEHYQWAKDRSDNPSIESVRLDPNNPTQYIYMGNNNWNDYFFKDNSLSQQHNLSFSGSKDNFNYFFSGNYTNEGGLNALTTDDWARYALRSKLGFTPLKWLSLESNTSLYQANRDRPSYNITSIYDIQPIDVATNPDGSWANTYAGRVGAQLVDGGRRNSNSFGFQTITRANVTLFKGLLTLTGDATFRRDQEQTNVDFRRYTIGFGPNDFREEGGEGSAQAINANERYNAYNVYTTLNKQLGLHQLQVIAGYNQESYEWEYTAAKRARPIVSSLPYISVSSGEQTVSSSFTDWAVQGIFGRINYIFNNRYILEFNGRYDGTSRFPKNDRWGFFPSFSAAWVISEEGFMRAFDNLFGTVKLRGSYGSLGNQAVSNYGYILNLPSFQTSYLIDGQFRQAIGAPGLDVDPENYTWEKVISTNLGLDFGLFKDRILATFDYYVRNTEGMLTDGAELPSVLGTAEPRANVADLETKGWEASVIFRNQIGTGKKPLNFDIRLNIGDSRSRITNFPNEGKFLDDFIYDSRQVYYPGQYIGDIWGLVNNGLYQTTDDIAGLDASNIIPWGALSIVPGWPRYIDQDGDGQILKGISVSDPKDFVIIGNSEPRYRYGIDFNMNWNGFDARVFFQGVGQRDYYPQHYLFWGPYQQPYANFYSNHLDFYRPTSDSDAERAKHSQAYINAGLADANTDATYPILQAWLADWRVYNGLAIPQTQYLQDASYIRLKNLTLGYTLPKALTQRIGINQFRIYLSGENLWEASDIKNYVDPEAIGSWSGYAYPFQRRYSVGLNVEF